MKRIIAMALSVLMLLTLFVGCKGKKNEALESAKAYLENMYQTGDKDEPMNISVDKEVLTVVTVDGESYDVEWSVEVTEGDKDSVKISESENENRVLIDIPDLTETDILFTAIATIKDKKNSIEAKFDYKVAGITVEDVDVETILNNAYALKEGEKMDGTQTLTGKVKSIDTAYSAQYQNVTVTIEIDGFADKPIICYRLKGNGADTLAVGDTITVVGTIVNYQGKIEFEAGCEIKTIVKADGSTTNNATTNNNSTPSGSTNNSTPSGGSNNTSSGKLTLVTDQARILKDAFALGKNETTPYIAQLEGKVISVDKEYSEQYGSVTVTMTVGGKNIVCYNMKVSGVSGGSKVKAGDTITVQGVIKNFYYDVNDASGKVEFTWDEATQTEVVLKKLVVGKEETKTLTVVNSPVVGTAYKFGFVSTSATKGGTYYAAGGMNGYYMATTTSTSAAIDVYLEQASGGYYLYTMIDGKKKYMNIKSTGTHVNAVYEDAPGDVLKYDTTKNTLVVNAVKNGAEDEYAFGTWGDYFTIGTTQTAKDGYFCRFYK